MASEIIGTHDLRLDAEPHGGFHHVLLEDADDGDKIVVNEDDLIPLRDRLSEIIRQANLEPSLDLAGVLKNLSTGDRKAVLAHFCRICGDVLESGDWTGLNYCPTRSPDPE